MSAPAHRGHRWLARRRRLLAGDGRPIVYCIATSGHPNYGDEAITATWLRFYARHLPEAEIWLDTPRPGASAVLFRGIHQRLHCVDTLFHAAWNSPSSSAGERVAFGARVLDEPGLIPREASGVELLLRADLIHVLGGGYINGIWPEHLALIGAAAAAGARSGAGIALTGAGLTPLTPEAAAAVGEALAEFSVVDVRDRPSEAMLRPFVERVSRSGDDLLLGLSDLPRQPHAQAQTFVCLQEDFVEDRLAAAADFVASTLRRWQLDEEPVTVVECLPPNDAAGFAHLRQRLAHVELLPFQQLWRDGFPHHREDRWLSTRFHPHLVAAASGCWGVAMEIGGDYYRTKHRSLVGLGSGWTLVDDLTAPVDSRQPPAAPFGGALDLLRQRKQDVAAAVLASRRA